MALFKPEASAVGGSWLGYQVCGIESFEDKGGLYKWAPVYLQVSLKVENSKYPQEYKIAGSFERNPDGTIKDNTLLRKIYNLMDVLGEDAGVNAKGEWEINNRPIPDIAEYLNDKYSPQFPEEPTMNLLVYIYEKWSDKDEKAYNECAGRIYHNDDKGKQELQGYVNFMKGKGYIKEHSSGEVVGAQSPTSPTSTVTQSSF
jgi:hypothetical protein